MPEITSTLADLNALGLFCDVGDVYVAMMTTEDTASAPPAYGAPVLACEAVSVEATPTYAEGVQRASGRTIRKVKKLTGMDVKVEYPRMKDDVRAMLLGRKVDENGGVSVGDGMSPLCAVGICAVRDDGTKVMRWVYKCRASEDTISAKTSEEGQIAYQIPVLNFASVALSYETDGLNGKERLPMYEADTASSACKWTQSKFFEAVCGPWSEAIAQQTGG